MVDQDAPPSEALDVGDDAFFLLRPFAWAGSFLAERDAPVAFQVSDDQVATATLALEGDDRVPGTEPTVELVEGVFKVVPGKPGTGIDPADVAAALPDAAAARGQSDRPVRIEVERTLAPAAGRRRRGGAGRRRARGPRHRTRRGHHQRGHPHDLRRDLLRTWVTLSTAPDGTVAVDLDAGKVAEGLRAALRRHRRRTRRRPLHDRGRHAGHRPRAGRARSAAARAPPPRSSAVPAHGDAGRRRSTSSTRPPTFTKAEAEKLGIVEEVGQPDRVRPDHGAQVLRVAGAEHPPHRRPHPRRGHPARRDLLRERARRPAHPGQGLHRRAAPSSTAASARASAAASRSSPRRSSTRRCSPGSTSASTRATRSTSAATRRGREATLSFPHPDLQIKNTTPYGVLIWPTYTDTSITVHLYSTHYVDVTSASPRRARPATAPSTPSPAPAPTSTGASSTTPSSPATAPPRAWTAEALCTVLDDVSWSGAVRPERRPPSRWPGPGATWSSSTRPRSRGTRSAATA